MRVARWVVIGLAVVVGGVVSAQVAVGAAEAWRALTAPAAAPVASAPKGSPARAVKPVATPVPTVARPGSHAADVTRLTAPPTVSTTVDATTPMSSLVQRREERDQWRENLTPEERRARREEARARRSELTPEERELIRVRKEATRALVEGRPANLPPLRPATLPPDRAELPDDEVLPPDDGLDEEEDW